MIDVCSFWTWDGVNGSTSPQKSLRFHLHMDHCRNCIAYPAYQVERFSGRLLFPHAKQWTRLLYTESAPDFLLNADLRCSYTLVSRLLLSFNRCLGVC